MKLTRELIIGCQTPAGAWNRHQLELLGVPWPPVGGWMRRIEGKEISEAAMEEVKRLGTVPAKERRQEAKALSLENISTPKAKPASDRAQMLIEARDAAKSLAAALSRLIEAE